MHRGISLVCVCSCILITFFHPIFVGWVSDAAMNSIICSDFTDSDPTISPSWNKNRVKNKSRNNAAEFILSLCRGCPCVFAQNDCRKTRTSSSVTASNNLLYEMVIGAFQAILRFKIDHIVNIKNQ